MTKKEYNKQSKSVAHAGSAHNKKKVLRTAIDMATHDFDRLEEAKARRRDNFRRRLEEWTGVQGDENPTPHVLPHERRVAHIFFFSGVIAILIEAIFAIPLTLRMGLPWWTGVLIAVLTAIVLHGGLTMAFRRSQRPRETYHTLKRWLLVPAFILAVISLMILLVARAASGWLLLALLPLLTVSLWTATVGLLILGAALLVASDVYNWATRDEAEYRQVDREQRRTMNYRREWHEDLTEIERHETPLLVAANLVTPSNGGGTTSPSPSPLVKVLPVALVAVLLATASACQSVGEASQSPNPANTSLNPVEVRSVDAFIDASYSGDDSGYGHLAHNLYENAPRLFEDFRVTRLTVSQFAEDGWSATQKLQIELPQLVLPQASSSDLGELGSLPNVQKAEEEQSATETALAEAKARQEYRKELTTALAPLSESSLRPPVRLKGSPGPRCTDLVGLLRRISVSRGSRIAIVVTDGHDTCGSDAGQIPAPSSEIALIIILVPEHQFNGQKSFDLRKQQLTTMVPWAEIVPYFADDIYSVVADAMRRRQSEKKPANR